MGSIYPSTGEENREMQIGKPLRTVVIPKPERSTPIPVPAWPKRKKEPDRILVPNWPKSEPAEKGKEEH